MIFRNFEEKFKGIKQYTLDTMIPVTIEDSNTVYREIDINGDGTITVDELFY
jgi:hypothetical protein